jgi:hypothetical protein
MKTRRGCTFLEFGNYTSAVEGTTTSRPRIAPRGWNRAVARGKRMALRVSRRLTYRRGFLCLFWRYAVRERAEALVKVTLQSCVYERRDKEPSTSQAIHRE